MQTSRLWNWFVIYIVKLLLVIMLIMIYRGTYVQNKI